MSIPLKTCDSCHKVIQRKSPADQRIRSSNLFYCCNHKQFYCKACSLQKCRICNQTRKKMHKEASQTVVREYKYSDCCSCPPGIEKKTFRMCFHQKKCGNNYCYRCMSFFYNQYIKLVQSYSIAQGAKIEMDVELGCRCEVTKQKVEHFVQKFCLICENFAMDESIKLQNGWRIEKKCYLKLIEDGKKAKQLNKKIQIQKKLQLCKNLMVSCQICEEKINGKTHNQWTMFNNIMACWSCFQILQNNQKQNKLNSIQFDPNLEKEQLRVVELGQEKSKEKEKPKEKQKVQEKQKDKKTNTKQLILHDKRSLLRTKKRQNSQIQKKYIKFSNNQPKQHTNNPKDIYFSEDSTHQKQPRQTILSKDQKWTQLQEIAQQTQKLSPFEVFYSLPLKTGLQQFNPISFQLQFEKNDNKIKRECCRACNNSIPINNLLFVFIRREDPAIQTVVTIRQISEIKLQGLNLDGFSCKYCHLKLKMQAKKQLQVLANKKKVADNILKRTKKQQGKGHPDTSIRGIKQFGLSILKKNGIQLENSPAIQNNLGFRQVEILNTKELADLVSNKLNKKQSNCKKCNEIECMSQSNTIQKFCSNCKERKEKKINPFFQEKNIKQLQLSQINLQKPIRTNERKQECANCKEKTTFFNSQNGKFCVKCSNILNNERQILKELYDNINPRFYLCRICKKQNRYQTYSDICLECRNQIMR